MDRKSIDTVLKEGSLQVALRKESVDRNSSDTVLKDGSLQVALRKESVDRNKRSEMKENNKTAVALRKESVDRNFLCSKQIEAELCSRSPQGEHGMFLFLTVQGGFAQADIRFNFKNCYSKKLSHKII